jgi:poly-gamma-glutamate synthesis protein (capsule biosynthesis protein)
VTRLIFRRYLLPFHPATLLLPVALIAAGVVALKVLAPPAEPATASASAGSEQAAPEAPSIADRPEPLLLTFLGDIMAHAVNFNMNDFSRIYADVATELGGDDLTFANLETPVIADRPYESYPRFNVKPAYVRAGVEAGIEVFSLANNHAADHGRDGIEATRAALSSLAATHQVTANGLRASADEPFEVTAFRVRGRRIGFVAVTQFLNGPATGKELVHTVDYREASQAGRFLEWVASRAPSYDLFIVSFHGGREYVLEPEPAKVRFFDRLVRAGADIVWSHHPHVVQPWRHIERRDGTDAMVLHSTGNFISGQTWSLGPEHANSQRAYTGDGALFRVRAHWDGAGRLVLHHDPLFVSNYRHPSHGMVVRVLDPLIADDLDPSWKRFYVVRRNALQEIAWRSESFRIARLD